MAISSLVLMITSLQFTPITFRQELYFQSGIIIFLAFFIFLAYLVDSLLPKTIWEVYYDNIL